MSEQPQHDASGGPAGADQPEPQPGAQSGTRRGHREERAAEEEHRVVVRDRRRIDPVTGAPRTPTTRRADAPAAPAADAVRSPVGERARRGRHAAREESEVTVTEDASAGLATAEHAAKLAAAAAELAKAQASLAERTADLQRVTAEYANYRKRVDRDRAAVVEAARGAVLAALLPVLDDLERAREHGDLTGAFKAVADQLEGTLERLGLSSFGTAGDPFDPMVHEAVAHQNSSDVTAPTCVSVLRRGYRHGERLLRPALVAVAEPAPAETVEAVEPVAPTDLPGAEAESAG